MTTTVTIEAHHAKTKQTEVTVRADGRVVESKVLEDGEKYVTYAYDNRFISVQEVDK